MGMTWAFVFVLGALLAPYSPWRHLEIAWEQALRPFGTHLAFLQIVWIVGGVPLTALVLLYAMGTKARVRQRWLSVSTGFVIGSFIEILSKHWIAFPLPRPVPTPLGWERLETLFNIGPSTIGQWIHGLHPATSRHIASHFLHGSYPSGHTFRISYVAGTLLSPRHRRWTAVIAALVAVMVTATGGHWIGDAIGGYALAMGLVTVIQPSPAAE